MTFKARNGREPREPQRPHPAPAPARGAPATLRRCSRRCHLGAGRSPRGHGGGGQRAAAADEDWSFPQCSAPAQEVGRGGAASAQAPPSLRAAPPGPRGALGPEPSSAFNPKGGLGTGSEGPRLPFSHPQPTQRGSQGAAPHRAPPGRCALSGRARDRVCRGSQLREERTALPAPNRVSERRLLLRIFIYLLT